MIKPLTIVPSPILRAKSKDVLFDKKTAEIIATLSDSLQAKTDPKGVGLSAPQIGKNVNIFVSWLSPDPENDPLPEDMTVFINPVLLGHSKEVTFGPDKDDPILEGCLSIPGLYGPVPRFSWVELEYFSPDGKKQQKKCTDFEARVIQHEFDHLEGILFTDYTLKYDLPLYEYSGKKMKEIDSEIAKAF